MFLIINAHFKILINIRYNFLKTVLHYFYFCLVNCCCCSIAKSVWLFVTPWTAAGRLPYPSLSPWVCSNSCSVSQWCLPTISSSAAPFSSCPQSFQASRSFPMSQLLAIGWPNIGASASASVLSVNIQGWFPLRLTDLISLQFKGFSDHNLKASILGHSAFFMTNSQIYLSNPLLGDNILEVRREGVTSCAGEAG